MDCRRQSSVLLRLEQVYLGLEWGNLIAQASSKISVSLGLDKDDSEH